jgi:hypothetical protein
MVKQGRPAGYRMSAESKEKTRAAVARAHKEGRHRQTIFSGRLHEEFVRLRRKVGSQAARAAVLLSIGIIDE